MNYVTVINFYDGIDFFLSVSFFEGWPYFLKFIFIIFNLLIFFKSRKFLNLKVIYHIWSADILVIQNLLAQQNAICHFFFGDQ